MPRDLHVLAQHYRRVAVQRTFRSVEIMMSSQVNLSTAVPAISASVGVNGDVHTRHVQAAQPHDVDMMSVVRAAGVVVCACDVDAALEQQRKEQADDIGAPHIPSVQWSDVGGLAHAKREILETIQVCC